MEWALRVQIDEVTEFLWGVAGGVRRSSLPSAAVSEVATFFIF